MKAQPILFWTFLLLTATPHTRGQVPPLIHFHGRLTQENQNFHGIGEFKFSLINSNGTETFWSNDGTGHQGAEPSNAVSVLVHKGIFSVTLGDAALPHMTPVSPLVFTNSDVHLRVWFRDERRQASHENPQKVVPVSPRKASPVDVEVQQEAKGEFELLTPDQRVTAVGYAMFAGNVPDGAINSAKLAANAVDASALAPDSVRTPHLANGAVTRDKLAPDAIPPAEVGDGSIATRHLADGAVTTSKLGDGAVATSKLVAGAVATMQLADRSVTQEKMAPASVGPEQLAAGTVGPNHLVSGAALANLMAGGHSSVAFGGMILAFDDNSSALAGIGYARSGSLAVTPDRWEIRTGPAPLVTVASIAVWTGTEVIAANTRDIRGFQGARYDPRSDVWRPISSAGAPTFRESPVFLWTGSEMIVWGGYHPTAGTLLLDGFRYNPMSDRWTLMTTDRAPSGHLGAAAVWTGTEMLVWGGAIISTSIPLNTGGRYDPLRNEWRPISTNNTPTARYSHTAVWTGDEMIVWGGQLSYSPRTAFNTGGRYRPSTDTWTATSLSNAPPAASEHAAIWTGAEMIVWGGRSADDGSLRTGARFNPVNNSWQPIALLNAPIGKTAHSAVWTGREMIVWGGRAPTLSQTTGTGGRYNPGLDEWFPLTTDSAPETLYDLAAFWLGDGMLLVGGIPPGNIDSSVMSFWRPALTAYLYKRQ